MPAASTPKLISDTSPASESTAAGDIVNGMSEFDSITVVASLLGATGGTLDVYLQSSWDGGTTWFDFVHFAQLASGASAVIYKCTSALSTSITTVGSGTSVALAAGSVAAGHWGDKMRALYVAGASTSAGAVQTIRIYGHRTRH